MLQRLGFASWLLALTVLLGACGLQSEAKAESPGESPLRDVLQRSTAYLEAQGREWFVGDVVYQERGCVSCHQVPSGLWGAAAAYQALNQPPSVEFKSLLKDAAQFIADPKVGRPAMWSQVMLAEADYPLDGLEKQLGPQFADAMLEQQRGDGAWLAKGQFPSQRRPLAETDAVVTMWMLRALERDGVQRSAEMTKRLAKARQFVEASKGDSTEWLAWRSLTTKTQQRDEFVKRLLAAQNDDGGWGWRAGEASNAYASGVALFALAEQKQAAEPRIKVAKWLLANVEDDGSWPTPSRLITKKESDSRDYVYRYWSTAWATIGLAEQLRAEAD